ncbi:M15 family metallopeptidase [Isoptericola aurantiacus]|uniref:M15 family metallopeptidase n=1 Tax=Isoptericola aurantiacus TaxID=3377839 RepID=UPI00383AB074
MATTTGLAATPGATGAVPEAQRADPDPAVSGVRAPHDVAADDGVVQRAALMADRGQAASRSGARTAPRSSAVVVPKDATLPAEQLTIDVDAAPEPPVLPGCDGQATGAGSNGYISSSEMCSLWDGGPSVRADAAVALARLNQVFRATFGENMCVTDGYRSYSQQVATRAAKGSLAAPPGTSNHGWGLAVDLCPETYSGSRYDWLRANAPAFGWDNPAWARTGGSKYEPWHWEFTAAVTAMGGVS